jgi:iron(II)-dependent oxidoreductase
MLQAIELAQLPIAPGLAAAPRRAASPGATGLEPVGIPAGPFTMGAPGERFSYDNERPRHGRDLPAFRIGRTAITNATFLRFVEGGGYQRREWWSDEGWSWKEDYDITHPQGWAAGWVGPSSWRQWRIDGDAPLHPDEPVVHLSWFEADALARAHGARLPTEAEWEKAARAGLEDARFPWGEERPTTAPFDRPPRPAETPANPLGLVALSGVCHEWCLDWEDDAYYTRSPSMNPRGPETGTRRVSRGGAWRHQDAWSPVAHRSSLPPALRYSDYGFRVVREEA